MVLPGVVVLVLLFAVHLLHERLMRELDSVRTAFAGVKSLLRKKCRHIPAFIALAQPELMEERVRFRELRDSRNRFLSGETLDRERILPANLLSNLLAELLAKAEAVPDLRNDKEFESIRRALTAPDDALARVTAAYNNAVARYNAVLRKPRYSPLAAAARLAPAQPLGRMEPSNASHCPSS